MRTSEWQETARQRIALDRLFPKLQWAWQDRAAKEEDRFWHGVPKVPATSPYLELVVWPTPSVAWEINEVIDGGHVGAREELMLGGSVAGDFEPALGVIHVFWEELTLREPPEPEADQHQQSPRRARRS